MKLNTLNDVFFAAHCDAVNFEWQIASLNELQFMRGTWERLMKQTGFNLKGGDKIKLTHSQGLERLDYIKKGIEPTVTKFLAKIDAKRNSKHN